jgi:hypothetical protein
VMIVAARFCKDATTTAILLRVVSKFEVWHIRYVVRARARGLVSALAAFTDVSDSLHLGKDYKACTNALSSYERY